MDHSIIDHRRDFTPPLQGGNLSIEHFPRVSPWAIFVPSLREKLLRKHIKTQEYKEVVICHRTLIVDLTCNNCITMDCHPERR